MRVVSFVLNLRSDALPEPSNPPERAASVPPPEKPFLLLPSGARAYTSLLGDKPFEPPAIFARQTGLPSQPLLALPPPPPNTGANAKEFRLTPDTLRYLGQTYERFSAQIQQVQLGYLAVQSRSALQKEEHERQARKFQEVMEKAKQLKTERREKTLRRVEEVKGEMNDLLARMKRVLGMIARKANPELSGVERRWFEELERMKEQVVGHGRYDGSSLVARGKMVNTFLLWIILLSITDIDSILRRSSTNTLGFCRTSERRRRRNNCGRLAIGMTKSVSRKCSSSDNNSSMSTYRLSSVFTVLQR